MVVAGDMMFQDQKFDMSHVTKYFQSKRHEGDLAIYYELGLFSKYFCEIANLFILYNGPI